MSRPDGRVLHASLRRTWLWRYPLAVAGIALAALLPLHAVAAQNGALFLLMPFGAKAVGLGEAVVADSTLGTEGMWWNSASLARLPKRELAVHSSKSAVSMNNMLTFALPSRVLGTVAASAMDVNYEDQDATDMAGNPIGRVTNHNYQIAVSYASPIGSRLSAGLTYKFVALRFECSGQCGPQPVISGNSSAVDFGLQYVLPTRAPVSVGLSVRNLGPPLQIRDAEQADPLPRVIQAGIRARVPWRALEQSQVTLDASADVISSRALQGAAGGVGVSFGYRNQVFLRGGYKHQRSEDKGASLGIGIERGALGIDIGRRFTNLAGQAGDPPTFVNLRARF